MKYLYTYIQKTGQTKPVSSLDYAKLCKHIFNGVCWGGGCGVGVEAGHGREGVCVWGGGGGGSMSLDAEKSDLGIGSNPVQWNPQWRPPCWETTVIKDHPDDRPSLF